MTRNITIMGMREAAAVIALLWLVTCMWPWSMRSGKNGGMLTGRARY